MERIIKEEINRISELMSLTEQKDSDYKTCERFAGSPQKMLVCRKIASLKGWLHNDGGLGLKRIINDKIKKLETEIPEEFKQHFIEGANLLLSIGKISDKELENFITNKVINNKLVYFDGVWQPVNKLNTNYADLAELLTDMIYRGGQKAKPTIQHVISNPEEGLLKIKPYLVRLFNEYFKNSEELNDYTKNIKRTSAVGEEAENKVKEVLEKLGFKSEYEGGNGDLIDMVFGTDLIMSSPEHGTKTIQVKNNEYSWDKKDKYKYVDWVIIANPFTIYDNKTKEVIEL
jgi:hypothetical protein